MTDIYLVDIVANNHIHLFSSWKLVKPLKSFSVHGHVIDVHSEDGLPWVGHGCTNHDKLPLIRHTWAICLPSHKVIFTSIVHVVVEVIVALGASVKDAHSEPVGVEVPVIRHRVHDGHYVAAVIVVGIEEFIGEDPHRSCGSSHGLVEHSSGIGAGAHHGGQGDLTVPTLSKNPKHKSHKQLKQHWCSRCVQSVLQEILRQAIIQILMWNF